MITITSYPKCQCGADLLPVEDTNQGATVSYLKGWVCSRKSCGFNVIQKMGNLISVKIADANETR